MNQTSNTGCEAVLYFSKEIIKDIQIFTFEPMKSALNHNHLLTPNFVESHRNCLNQKQIEEIVYQTKVGVLPGRIRTNTQSSFVGTCMTNIYGLPLEVIICVDQESHTQILSYGFLENKSTQSFINFFSNFKIF